ncbi:MAG TPA: hypothetical protein VM307_16620 [Egibacteraceae bacterium]|nr:hypothetical protein [Egibacteraceae bacterium]
MSDSSLPDLAHVDDDGVATYRLLKAANGDLVLAHPEIQPSGELSELAPEEREHLAEASADRPALVVETTDAGGRYVVLVDEPVNLSRHVPLGPADAELLAAVTAVARFGRRDEDLVVLTPWSEDDEVEFFKPEGAGFEDVPMVSLDDDGELVWHRGAVTGPMELLIRVQLRSAGAAAGVRYGVLTNTFGECVCIGEGSPVLPHDDVRRHALVGIGGLLDGATSLADAAARLRGMAEKVEEAAAEGWVLSHPVSDDLILAERHDA